MSYLADYRRYTKKYGHGSLNRKSVLFDLKNQHKMGSSTSSLHAAIAEERGEFTMDDVAAGITAKLRRRNPHVFDPASLGRDADSPPLDATEVNEIWQQVKRDEKGPRLRSDA